MCMFYWLLFGIFFDTKYNKNTKGNAKLNKAIIFDLDGTLWDSTGCASDIWNRKDDGRNWCNIISGNVC